MFGKVSILIVIIAIGAWYFFSRANNKASSVVFLAINYLARPHIELQPNHHFEPITLPSAWNGSYLSQNPHIWMYELTDSDKATIDAGVRHFQGLNKTMEEMKVQDFPVSEEFLRKIQDWKRELTGQGRGFQVLRGVPVKEWTMKQSEIFFFALGKYLGNPGAQDIEGSLLGHVKNIGETGKVERPYRKSVDIAYHCDGADIVGLLCMHSAKSGGASRIVSSVTAYNELLKHPRGQEYVHRLFGKVLLFTRKTFGLSPYLPVYPLRQDGRGVLRSYWNQEFYLKSYRHPENGTLTENGRADPFVVEAVEAYDAILNRDITLARAREERLLGMRSQEEGAAGETQQEQQQEKQEQSEELGLSMYLQQGDVQLVSNHFVLHARTEFTDYTDLEIAQATQAAAGVGAGAGAGKREGESTFD